MRKRCPISEGGGVACGSEGSEQKCDFVKSMVMFVWHSDSSVLLNVVLNSSKSAHLPDCTKTAAGNIYIHPDQYDIKFYFLTWILMLFICPQNISFLLELEHIYKWSDVFLRFFFKHIYLDFSVREMVCF